MQWLTRSPDTREIPSSSLGIVIFLLFDFHFPLKFLPISVIDVERTSDACGVFVLWCT